MEPKRIFVLFFIVFSTLVNAQTETAIKFKIDSLQTIIRETNLDSNKIVALQEWDLLIYETDQEADFYINKKIEKICRTNLNKKQSKKAKRFYILSLAEACNNIGGNLATYGDYKQALKYHLEALKLSEKLNDYITEAGAYTGLGNVYGYIGNHDKSILYYRKAYRLHIKNSDFNRAASSLNNLGIEANYQNQKDSSIYFYRQSLKYTDVNEYPFDFSTTLNNIGTTFYESGQNDSAMLYFLKSLEIADKLNFEDNQSLLYNNIALVYIEKGELKMAEELFLKADKLAIKINNILYSLDANNGLYDLYKSSNRIKEALVCLERIVLLNDSLYNQETKKLAIEEAFQLDLNKIKIDDSISKAKQKEISDLQLKSKNEEIANQKNKQIILYGGLALVFVFAGFMYNRFRITKKQKGIIEEQKLMVEEKQKEILDSITYAKRIQKAILPSGKLLNSTLPEHFVLYRPKDIVAGDFYWMEKKGDLIYLAACDCTGHGVPGAMVSVVCNNALNRAVREYGIKEPSKILDQTRELVIAEFEKSDEDVKDGMDISLCSLNLKTNILEWSGANNPLWIIRDLAIMETKPDKQPIGRYLDAKPFSNHHIQLQQGDQIYLFTDGYSDQFGGDKGKKFKLSNLQKLLIELNGQPMNKQSQFLNLKFEEWKGNLEQVDDVCVIGIRI